MALTVPEKADVSLRVPADGAYVSVLRTMTAGLAARLDFTVDDIEDLRIAVGEACAVVLPEAMESTDLTAEFRMGIGVLAISVSVPTDSPRAPDHDSFAWQVLSTLATEVTAVTDADQFVVAFTAESSLAAGGGTPGADG